MNFQELPARLATLEADIASERGNFVLFALFLREEVPDRWDLIVSAPWAVADETGALDYLVARIKSDLGPECLTLLSRIVFVDPADVALQNLNRAVNIEHGAVEVRDRYFFGLPIKLAYFITSKSPATLVSN